MPRHLSNEAKSILYSLLERNPNKRLGSGPSGADEIKNHTFFKGYDWDKVLNREYPVPPPHKRQINNETLAASILDDLTMLDDETNKLPGWSFINMGASEIQPDYNNGNRSSYNVSAAATPEARTPTKTSK